MSTKSKSVPETTTDLANHPMLKLVSQKAIDAAAIDRREFERKFADLLTDLHGAVTHRPLTSDSEYIVLPDYGINALCANPRHALNPNGCSNWGCGLTHQYYLGRIRFHEDRISEQVIKSLAIE